MPYNITVDPTSGANASSHNIKIDVSNPSAYQGTAAKYQYAFSTKENLDAEAMKQLKPFYSGNTVILDGGTGEFYLHIVVSDSLGTYRTQRGPYTISNDVPAFTVSASTDKWTKNPVRVFLTMSDANYFAAKKDNLELYMRDNTSGSIGKAEDFQIAGATAIRTSNVDNKRFYFDATQNGSWALLARDKKSGNTYFSTVMVSCVDTTLPTAELSKNSISPRVTTGAMADYGYTSPSPSVYAYGDDALSGLKSAEYQFSTSATAPASGWKPYKDGDVLSVREFFGADKSGSFYLYLRTTDNADNVNTMRHGTPFVVPSKTPPTIVVEVEPLPAGLNDFGALERAYTAAELTSANPLPANLTGRSACIKVTVKKSVLEGGTALGALMLPINKSIYDNNIRPMGDSAAVYVDGWEIKDLDPAEDIISIRYPAEKNAIYRFMGSDKNGNSTGFENGTVIITGIDKDAPEIDYGKYDKNGKMLLPNDWVKGEDGVTLKLSFSDLTTPLYGAGDTLREYIGSGDIKYQIIKGSNSETDSAYQEYNGAPISVTVHENDTFLVKVRDRIGNSYIQRIAVTNIDSTPPYVDTTNTSFGVGVAPIKMQLKYADKEMGLVKVRRYAVTEVITPPAESEWQDYNGGELSITTPGTWYVHYLAQDDVGHTTQGYFGPYTVDSGKPAITIDSTTSDEYITDADGNITDIFRDDRPARMHSAQVAVLYPATVTTPIGEKREYQWSQKTSPSLFGWKDAPAATVDADNAQLTRFTLDSWGSDGVSGRWYLHIRTKGTISYRGFMFDNDLPVITIIGDNPVYLPRGESYVDRGATAVDAQDKSVAVTTKLVVGKDDKGKDIIKDTRFLDSDRTGEHVVTYTATDAAGNTTIAQRVVFIYDDKPPRVLPFARSTNEDLSLAFSQKDFTEHFEDDSNKLYMDENGNILRHNALGSVVIKMLPAKGTLRLDGALIQADDNVPLARLDGLSYQPNENYFGADSFTYQAYDTGVGDRAANLSINTATISLTINSLNDTPTADNLTTDTTEEQAVTIELAPFIADVENSTSLAVTLGDITATPAATSNVNETGTATVSGQIVTYTPAKDFNGTVRIPYTATDADNASATATITVIVANVNDAPVMVGELTLSEGESDDKLYRNEQTVTVSWQQATDVDNDALTYRLTYTKPDASTYPIIGKLEGTSYVWTVPKLDGKCTVSITANDGKLDSNSITSAEFIIDSTKPIVEKITPNEHAWGLETSIAVNFTVSDVPSGHQNTNLLTEYAVDTSGDGKNYTSGTWASASGTAVTAEGFSKVRVRVTDAAGNVSEVKASGEYRLDRTAPLSFSATSSLNAVAGNDVSATTQLTVNGKTIDDTTTRSGVSGLQATPYAYKLDGEEYTTADANGKHTFATSLKPDTLHTMTIKATDVAGNEQTAEVTAYTRAQDAQTATLTTWDSGNLAIAFTAPANRQGETLYKAWLTKPYSVVKIAETGYNTELTRSFTELEEDTKYILYIQSKNGDEIENTAVRFDKDTANDSFKTNKKPVLTLDDNTSRYYKAGEIITLTGTVEDTDVAFHGTSAIPTIKVSFGGVEKDATLTATTSLFGLLTSSTKWNWTVDFTVDGELQAVPDGKYQPTVTATDNKTETGALSFGGVWLDSKNPNAPKIEVTDAPAQNPLVFSKEQAVLATLTQMGDQATGTAGNENPSQFRELRYKLDGDATIAGGGQSTSGAWLTVTSGNNISVTDEGHTTLTTEAEDNAKNTIQTIIQLYIDRTRPTQNTAPAAVFNGAPYRGDWVSGNIDVTLTANDTIGVGKIYAIVTDNNTALGESESTYDNALTKTYSITALEKEVTTTITLAAQQQNYIHYMYVDTAGNKQTFVAGPYKIDTTAPAPVFAVNAKELTSDGNSVILRGHGASVAIFDAANTGSNASDSHVASLAKAEFVWLPARITTPPTTGESIVVDADSTTPLPKDDGSGTYSWAEFTNGATLVHGGNVNGKWHLWVRLTDTAGNVKCYNEGENLSRPANQTAYPVFRFDNTAPSLPEKDGSGLPMTGTVVNKKTYGSLDIKLPTDDKHFDDSNSEKIEYQYTFTTTADPPPKDGLPVFKFESYSQFLAFSGSTVVTINNAATADTAWSHGVTLAAEFMAMSGDNNGNFHSLLDMGGFKVRISNVTGAIVVTDSNGTDKHLGGGYNDGRIHKLVVSAGFNSAIKVYADGKYLGRFWFPNIDKTKLKTEFTMGNNLTGLLYKATLFGRMADDDEGKSFIFRTNDIVGDYVFCAGLADNVSADKTTITDRSGQENNATVNTGAKWDREYKSDAFLFLSDGAVNPLINLDQYLPQFRKAKELTVSTTFKTTKATGAITHGDATFGNRVNNILFSANYGGFDTLYISPYKSTDGTDSGLMVLFNAQTATIVGGAADWNKATIVDLQGLDVSDGNTHTATVTIKGDKAMVYVDSLLKTTVTLKDKWLTNVRPKVTSLKAGGISTNSFKGTLYNTHIFARALTQDEIESGNINYIDRPIALLNYTKEQSGDLGNDFDSVVQAGEGMRFDDSGDYIDLGSVNNLGISSTADFSASVRFNPDRIRWSGNEWGAASDQWSGNDPNGGMELLAFNGIDTYTPNFMFGLYGDGTQRMFFFARTGSGGISKTSGVIEGLVGGDHYATASYDATTRTVHIFLDGMEVITETLPADIYSFDYEAYLGAYAPAGLATGIFPAGAGQFQGTMYNFNLKKEQTTLTQHIEETVKHVTTFTNKANLVGSYNLDEASGAVLKPAAYGIATPINAVLHGIGDAGIQLDGNQWVEFNLGNDIPNGENTATSANTFEVTYKAPTNKPALLIDQGKNIDGTTKAVSTARYLTINHSTSGGYYGDGGKGTFYPSPAAVEKVRLTAVYDGTTGKIYQDGVLIHSESFTPAKDLNHWFRLGSLWDSDAQAYMFKGTMYDAKVWNKALTAEQVAGTETYTYNDIAVHYDFAGDNVLKDKSGHGHDGTMNSATPAVTGLYPRFDGTTEGFEYVTGVTYTAGATNVSIDTAFTIEPQVDPHNFIQLGIGGTAIPLWLRTEDGGKKIHLGINGAYVGIFPLNAGRAVHTFKGTVNASTYDITVDGVRYTGATPLATQTMPTTNGNVYIGNGGSGGANMKGTLYKLNATINGAKLEFGAGGKTAAGAWVESGGNNFTPDVNVKWVPAPADIKGEYPEFLGGKAGTSYAETAAGLINYNSPFTFKMKLKPLSINSVDNWQTYAALGKDILGDSALPFFFTSIGGNSPLQLYTSGGGHKSVEIGSISPAGNYDISFTANVSASTYSAVVNGVPITDAPIPILGAALNNTDGKIYLANRLYSAQAGHFVLHEFEALQGSTTVCRYDGTRSWDGTKLIDVSGNNNHATLVGNVNWVTGSPESISAIIPVPSGAGYTWVQDDLSSKGETIISVSNTTVQGKVYLHVWVRDALGNELQRTYGPFDYDTTRPSATISARKPKGTEIATSAFVAINVSDNWLLKNTETRWATKETAGRLENPETLFTSATWANFGELSGDKANRGTANTELADVGNNTTPQKYYVAVEAEDWLGNRTVTYLYVDSSTLFDDSAAPTITFTNIGNNTAPSKRQMVQVDVEDAPESGKTASGVNAQTLQYAWHTSTTAPATGWQAFTNHNTLRKEEGDGAWYLHIKAADNAGNSATGKSDIQPLDNTKPTLDPARAGESWSKTDFTVNANAADPDPTNGSGISKIYWASGKRTVDHFAGGAVPDSGITEITGGSFTASALGEYTLYAVDKAGNEVVADYNETKLDAISPTVRLTPELGGWTKDSITVTVAPADAGGSGVALVSYTLNSGTSTNLAIGGGNITIDTQGENILVVTVTDGAGNIGTATGVYKIDAEPNTITLTQNAATLKEHNVAVTVAPTTAGAAASARYGWGAGTSRTAPLYWSTAALTNGKFNVIRNTGDGTWTLFVESTSATGVVNSASGSYAFDNTAPVLTLTLATEDWTQATTLAVASEAGARLKVMLDNVEVSKDTRARSAITSYPVTINGVYSVTATDGAGNIANGSLTVTNIDTTAPTATLTPAGGTGKWFNAPLTVTAIADDIASGIKDITYTVGSTGNLTAAKLTTDGTHTVAATATDNAGNSFTTTAEQYQLDKVAPTLAPTATVTESTLTVVPTAIDNDNGSGINADATTATLEEDRANIAVNGTFNNLAANKGYTVNVTAADNAGNTATKAMEVYTLAATPTGLANVKVLSTALTATLQAGTNSIAPAYSIKVYKQGQADSPLYNTGEKTRSTAISATFSAVGKDEVLMLEVTAYNEDNKPNSKTFQITGSSGIVTEVNQPPNITVTKPAKALLGAKDTLTLSGTASDVNGGKITVEVTVNGVTKSVEVAAGIWALTWAPTELREGEYEGITATATDDKGEKATAIVPKITVDKTAPLPPIVAVATEWVANATFTPTPNDADSDVAGYEYRVNNGAWQTYTAGAAIVGSSGEYILEVRAVDHAGNTGNPTQKTVRIENTRPSITGAPIATNGWLISNTSVTLDFTDEYMLINAGWLISKTADLTAAEVATGMTKAAIATDKKTATATVTLGKEDGTWYIYGLAKDNVGTTMESFGPYQVDSTPPTIPVVTATAITATTAILEGASGITDTGSGIDTAKTLYHFVSSVDAAAVATSADGNLVGLAPNALYDTWLTAEDNAGNTAKGASTRFSTLAADPTNVSLAGRGKDFLTFAITGDTSNATPPEYRILLLNADEKQVADSGWATSLQVRLPVAGDAWQVHGTIQTRNRERKENAPIALTKANFPALPPSIDDGFTGSSAPVITLNAAISSNVLHDGDSLVLTGTASDADGDALYITATIDSMEKTVKLEAGDRQWQLSWNIATDRLCAGTFGSYSDVTVTAMDSDDNRATVTDTNTYRIDNAGPHKPIIDGGLPALVKGTDEKYTVTLNSGSDRGAAGVASWSYTLDGVTVTGNGSTIPPITVNGDSKHTLKAFYTDALGNAGEATDYTFTVDSIAPVATETKLETYDQTNTDGWVETSKQPSADVWYNANLRASYTFSDGKITYAVTASADVPEDYDKTAEGQKAQVSLNEGVHWVHLRAEDAAGNVTLSTYGPYQVDLTPVSVTITVDNEKIATSHTVNVKANSAGEVSGVATAEYLWSDAQVYSDTMTGWQSFAPAGEAFTLTGKSGTWYLYAKVTDKAGNRTLERSNGLNMDNTPPELAITKSADSTLRKEIALATVTDEHSSVTRQSYLEGRHPVEDFATTETNFGDGDITLAKNGIYTFFAEDQAGNAAVKEYSVTALDGGIPTITAVGPAKVWNKSPFTVTVTILDPEGKLDKVGIIDPQQYLLPVTNPNSKVSYMQLSDINGIISPLAEGIDERHFTDVRSADTLLDANGKLTVTVGSGTGTLSYSGDGSIMLHFAALDKAGNVTYASFGPYLLDTTPPTLTLDTPNTILATVVDPSEAGQYNFTGYNISDNLTKQFVPADAKDIERGTDEGVYEFVFDTQAMDNFTVDKTYPNAVKITITDAAGNVTTTTVNCKVCDNLPPVYGNGTKNLDGILQDNYIDLTINPTIKNILKPADFVPTEGANRLNETSLPLQKITLNTLPNKGKLLLNGTELTVASLPKDILWGDIVAEKLVYQPNENWSGPDTQMSFLAMDRVGNQSKDTGNCTQVRIRADGAFNPEYQQALEKLKATHIVTNVVPTLADVKLPTGWSFTEDTTKRLKASNDQAGLQSFNVRYTPTNPHYSEVALKHDFPVSTVALEVAGGLDMRTIEHIGGTLTLHPVKLKVTGAPLPNAGEYSTANMEWRSSCPSITTVTGDAISNSDLSATVTALDKGVSLIGVAYKGSNNMLGYVLIKVVEERSDSANTIKDVKDITTTLEALVDTTNPSETEIKAVNAVADEVTKLPLKLKSDLKEEDIKALDNLKKEVNKDLNIEIIKDAEGNPPQLKSVDVVGAAIACGVSSGTVKIYLTPVEPSGKDTKMEIKLEMQVGGTKDQLKAPLFFTMELPDDLDTDDLAIWHIKEKEPAPIVVPFVATGQNITFKLDSFSSLKFNLASGDAPIIPPINGGEVGGGGGDNNGSTSSQPEVEVIEPPTDTPAPETPQKSNTGTSSGNTQAGNDNKTSDGTTPDTTQPDDDQKTGMSAEEKLLNDADRERYKDAARNVLDNTIATLPDSLSERERQAYIDELTKIVDASIIALDGETDPTQWKRILKELEEKMGSIAEDAVAHAIAAQKPFVVASAIFSFGGLTSAALTILKKKPRKRKIASAIAAAGAVMVFLLTTGWNGYILVNWWSIPVGIFAAVAVGSLLLKGKAEQEDE